MTNATHQTTAHPALALRELFAKPEPVTVGDATIIVQPLGWWRSVDAIDAIAPALLEMPNEDPAGMHMARWIAWVTNYRESLLRFVMVCTDLEREDIEPLSPAHLVELLFGLLEVNADFFVASLPVLMQKLGPRANSLMDRVSQAIAKAAETASQGFSKRSSNTATGTAK